MTHLCFQQQATSPSREIKKKKQGKKKKKGNEKSLQDLVPILCFDFSPFYTDDEEKQ